MRTIVFNRANIIADGKNNKLEYNFPNSVKFQDSYIAVSQVNMFYSWVNIGVELGNNKISFWWWSGNAPPAAPVLTENVITIPDGLYQITELNFFLQKQMIDLGAYLINDSQNNVYPIEVQINPTRYAVQINTYQFPDPTAGGAITIPALWNTPSNWIGGGGGTPAAGMPSQSFNAQIELPAKINVLMGYIPDFKTDANIGNVLTLPLPANGIKDATTGSLSYLSTSAPDVNPNSSVYLNVSNIDNVYSSPTGIIYAVTPNVVIGGQISEKPPQFSWNKLLEGTYNNIRLTLLGIDLQPISILDPNMTIIMVIKDRNEL
tara:strand:+ start:101 stop:1057 length:957 start_codon:yes stop_codon:yes gene_type:complete